MECWDAWTRQNGHRTSDTATISSFFFFFPIRADLHRRGLNWSVSGETAETLRFRQYWRRIGWFRLKFKKKRKKVQNAPFELNNKTLNYLSSQPDSFFNLQLSHSMCSPIPSRLSALHLPSLTQSHSQESQLLTHSHFALHLPSGINLKLSILVFHSSHMLWLLLNVSVIWFIYLFIYFYISCNVM